MSGIRIPILAAVVVLVVTASSAHAAEDAAQPVAPQQYNLEGRRITGTVVTTSSVASYTYVQIDTGDGVVWAAAPRTQVKEGDTVLLPDGSPIPDFYSSSLGRRFDIIYFASSMQVHSSGGDASMDLYQHCPPGESSGAEVDVSGTERAPGGLTIGEILERAASLAGEEVSLRGKVVKCSRGILGRTWIHLRDGTLGPEGAGDVTITTQGTAAIGDTILVRGTVVLDQDFGYGYRYDLLIEDASITIE